MVYWLGSIMVYGMSSIMVFGLSSIMAYRLSFLMDADFRYALNAQLSKTGVLSSISDWTCCSRGKLAARESLYPT